MTKKYEKDNPLGGPANMFEAIAGRIRSGEEYEAVLFDYGLETEKEADERVVMAMDVSKIELAEVKLKAREAIVFLCRRLDENGIYSPALQPVVKEALLALDEREAG